MTFPEQIHSFPTMQDVQASDMVDVVRYKFLINKGTSRTPDEDQELNNLKIKLDNKNFNADKINKIYEAIIELEIFFRDNTVGYIEEKQQEFQAEIDEFSDKGDYIPTKTYFEKNFVLFNDGSGVKTYLCIKDNDGVGIVGIEPTNPEYWRMLTITGAKGEDGIGIGLTFRGEWDNTRVYAKDEGVQYGGLLFASLIDNNVGNEPDISQDTDYWARVLDVTVTVGELKGIRTLVSSTSNVNFMTGDITSFNPNVDSLTVYKNTVQLYEGIHYEINADNQSIDKISGTWDGTPEIPMVFEFIVIKNIVNNLLFKDGSALEDGTVAKSKLTVDVQNDLNQIQTNTDNINTNSNNITDLAGVGRMTETVKENADNVSNLATQMADLASNYEVTITDEDGTELDHYTVNAMRLFFEVTSPQNINIKNLDGKAFVKTSLDMTELTEGQVSLDYDSGNVGLYDSGVEINEKVANGNIDIKLSDMISTNVLDWSNDNISYDVSSIGATPQGMTLSNDGNFMYICGYSSSLVIQFELSNPFDLSTASQIGSFTPIEISGNPITLCFNNDGTKLFLGASYGGVYQYTLSTPWDITTATYDNVSYSSSGEITTLYNMKFSSDGDRLVIADNSDDTIHQYTLSAPWDLSTISYDNYSYSVAVNVNSLRAIAFTDDGYKLFVTGDEQQVTQYNLTTPFDISTLQNTGDKLSVPGRMFDMDIKNDNKDIYFYNFTNKTIMTYSTLQFLYNGTTYIGVEY